MLNDSSPADDDVLPRALRIAGIVLFAAWVLRYMHEPEPLLHGSILIFHEAGHIIFMPFGEFMAVLGGSLLQLIVPLFVMGVFLQRRDYFAVCVVALYLAASLDNLAAYIADARAGELPLLGGERSAHDWTYLLIELGKLDRDIVIGRFVENLAVTIFWPALLTGVWLAWTRRSSHVHADIAAADAPRPT